MRLIRFGVGIRFAIVVRIITFIGVVRFVGFSGIVRFDWIGGFNRLVLRVSVSISISISISISGIIMHFTGGISHVGGIRISDTRIGSIAILGNAEGFVGLLSQSREIRLQFVRGNNRSLLADGHIVIIRGSTGCISHQITSGRIDYRRLLNILPGRSGMTAPATLARLERSGKTAHAAGQRLTDGHLLDRLLSLLIGMLVKLPGSTHHHAVTAAMRRHGEHGSGQHRPHSQQTANEIERRSKIRQRLTRPGERDIRILLLAQINKQNRRIVLHIAFELNALRVACHGMPHVGILEIDAFHSAVLRRSGILPCRRAGLLRTQRLPIIKTCQAHIAFTGQPSGGILGGGGGNADLPRSARQHLHPHIAIH